MSTGVVIQNIMLNGQAGPKAVPTDNPQVTGLPGSSWYIPGGLTLACDWVEWIVIVQSLQGAPTTARFNLGFEMGVTTSFGNEQPQASPGTYNFSYTDARPYWQSFRATDYPDLLPDGEWPEDMATQATSLPLMVKRRVRGGFRHRLRVTTFYSGGTSPAFLLTVHQNQRY